MFSSVDHKFINKVVVNLIITLVSIFRFVLKRNAKKLRSCIALVKFLKVLHRFK